MFALLTACTSPLDLEATATLDEAIPSIAHVRWDTPETTVGWVEFGPDASYGHMTPTLPQATSHSATLLGIPAGATWHYRVAVVSLGDVAFGPDQTVTVGTPEGLPPITTERHVDHDLWGEYTVMCWWSVTTDDSFVSILDRDGAMVWWWEPEDGYAESVRINANRTELIVLLAGIGADVNAQIARVPLDGGEPTYIAAPGAHHDVVERGDTIAYLAGEERVYDGQRILGDVVREIDTSGNTTEVWNAFDDGWPMEPEAHSGWDQNPVDWTHANGLAWDEASSGWAVSLFWDQTVVVVDPVTREVVWRLGGPTEGAYEMSEEAVFGPQHSPLFIDGELGIFDNASHRGSSRLARYAIDHDAREATLTWQWEAPADTYTRLMGNWHPLEGGGVVSAWGELEEILLIEEDGTLAETISLDALGLLGRVNRTDGLYPRDATFAE